ncbi:flagellar assembly protein FliW [Paenibacillus thalictri]|uniref:Flagellar assembly factor FliW n=1 Tax=Paenibacillus thalictri TaxID=2527873 RepID=A0A4Q9DKZ3_9BACL|nr:flagellar assembly protein FliW [Paenibacillus thalictri]TBL72995.1 flagellar assembly protein FliW [Paenibacillus thalictri]
MIIYSFLYISFGFNPEKEVAILLKLTTSRFGEIEIDEQGIVSFAHGIPGFDQMNRFVFLHQNQSEIPFSFMQSVQDGDLAFIVVDPFQFFPNYNFELPESVQADLQVENESDLMVFSIMSISKLGEISLNLLAPVIINQRCKLGKQMILHQTDYKTKHFFQIGADSAAGKGGGL